MKHLPVFLLLAVLLYNLVGVYPVAVWRQHEFRREAEARRHAALPAAALVRIAVGRESAQARELVWHESNEFSLRGHLFDVVRQDARRDSVVYLCWPDQGEETLLANLGEHVREYAHPDNSTRKSAKKLFDYLSKVQFLLPADEPGLNPRPVGARPAYPVYGAGLRNYCPAAPFAPPRLLA